MAGPAVPGLTPPDTAELRRLRAERDLVLDASGVGLAWIRDGRIAQGNAALAWLTGHDEEALVGLPVSVLQEDPGAAGVFDDGAALGLRGQGRLRLRRADGTLRWVQVAVRSVDEQDISAGLLCSFVDVDDRERARESLQAGAVRVRSVLDSVLVGIVTVGDQGIEWMNHWARRMFGGELADFVGEPLSGLADDDPTHPLRRDDWLQRLQPPAAPQTFECRLRSRDGRAFWVLGNAVRTQDEAAGRPLLTFAFLDIDERRQADAQAARAQTSLRRVIETAPLAIVLFEARSHRVLQLNVMSGQFFGREAGALAGQTPGDWTAWLGAEEAQALRASLVLAADAPEGVKREITRPATDGTDRRWDARFVSLSPAAPGEPGQVLMVASDVTEQRRAEQERLDAAVSQRGMLVKEVHHRIKNNLQGVAGLLQQSAQRHPEVATQLSDAVAQVQAIAQVYGLQVGAAGPLQLASLLQAIAASVQRTFGHTVEVSLQDGQSAWQLPEPESIPVALTFNELLTNAVKHGSGEPVRCSLRAQDDGVLVEFVNHGTLREGVAPVPAGPGAHGLGLVRALLPRRSASLVLEQRGAEVVARVSLRPPGVVRGPSVESAAP